MLQKVKGKNACRCNIKLEYNTSGKYIRFCFGETIDRSQTWPNSCLSRKSMSQKTHSLIRGVLIQSCSSGAKKFTNYVFCYSQFSSVIQNIENCCTIRAKFWKFDFWLYEIDYFDNNRHRQIGVKMAQQFSIFWITPLNCGWQNT